MDRLCAHDPFLAELCNAVKTQAETKMIAGGVDIAAIKARLGRP
jgi:putative hydrolases of HD superfamily